MGAINPTSTDRNTPSQQFICNVYVSFRVHYFLLFRAANAPFGDTQITRLDTQLQISRGATEPKALVRRGYRPTASHLLPSIIRAVARPHLQEPHLTRVALSICTNLAGRTRRHPFQVSHAAGAGAPWRFNGRCLRRYAAPLSPTSFTTHERRNQPVGVLPDR